MFQRNISLPSSGWKSKPNKNQEEAYSNTRKVHAALNTENRRIPARNI
jgi:hypothetical protein